LLSDATIGIDAMISGKMHEVAAECIESIAIPPEAVPVSLASTFIATVNETSSLPELKQRHREP
jgi:hypothetical protein